MSRTYVVTGYASGIGAATAVLLRERGHRVIGIDLHDADIVTDLSTPHGRELAIEATHRLSDGQLDGFIASAGISEFHRTCVSVIYFGAVELLEGLRPVLAASRAPRAAVVTCTAEVALVYDPLVEACLRGDETEAVELAVSLPPSDSNSLTIYTSVNRALARWVRRRSISDDWAHAGIALNAVAPGVVKTPMTQHLFATPERTAHLRAIAPMPLNGFLSPEAVAALLAWVTSDENTHVTGQSIYCDGGNEVCLRGDDVWSWYDGIPVR
ncbi:SDR family oxidoreductase [Micrococcales bacterium 31B]|nr:SDR family oxidoreductase [Micrococcales bacterium 31B]